ncbi:MAG: hypothetical protein QF363_00370 [Planctomycetaceae bacterium]|jgi:hypothetical protein|nr:hypothetical protein [Planctomycetaceae bacterium]
MVEKDLVMVRRVCLGSLLVIAICGWSVAAEPVVKWPPRLLLNSDCGTPVFYRFDAPMDADQLCRVLDDLPGTKVDAFLPCPQFSDDQFWFPTTVAESYDGRHVPDGKYEDKYFKRVAENVKSLADRGIDPMIVWQQRARRHGLVFIPTLRMNDVHKDYVDRWPSLRSFWERKRQHLLIGKQIPGWYPHPYKFSWAMDYAQQEVRDRKLAIITELCSRYDVDGFEMDFLRSNLFFRRGHESKGALLMNAFVGEVHRLLVRLGKQRKKTLRLVVRVPAYLPQCREMGLDVPTWIREGLVDMVVPMAAGYLDMTADVGTFVKLARGTGCKVAGGLEYYVRGYMKPGQRGITQASIQMLRAGAASFWERGVDAIYLFNYDCHGPFPFRGEKRQALNEIHDPARLAGTDQRYLVAVEMNRRLPPGEGYMQLPRELTRPGQASQFTLVVGDDVPGKTGQRRSRLILRTSLSKTGSTTLGFRCNDRLIKPSIRRGGEFVFDDPPVRRGSNTLKVTLAGKAAVTVRLSEIELLIQRDLPELKPSKTGS